MLLGAEVSLLRITSGVVALTWSAAFWKFRVDVMM